MTIAGSYDSSSQIWSGLSLASGQSFTMTLSGMISPNASGFLTNTVTVAPPDGLIDLNPANNTATDTDCLTPKVDLCVTKTDGVVNVVPGTMNTYTITVNNAGPSTITSFSLID